MPPHGTNEAIEPADEVARYGVAATRSVAIPQQEFAIVPVQPGQRYKRRRPSRVRPMAWGLKLLAFAASLLACVLEGGALIVLIVQIAARLPMDVAAWYRDMVMLAEPHLSFLQTPYGSIGEAINVVWIALASLCALIGISLAKREWLIAQLAFVLFPLFVLGIFIRETVQVDVERVGNTEVTDFIVADAFALGVIAVQVAIFLLFSARLAWASRRKH